MSDGPSEHETESETAARADESNPTPIFWPDNYMKLVTTVHVAETTLELTRIPELELERDDLCNVRVAVEGRVDDGSAVDDVLRAENIRPVSITVETGTDTGESDAVD